MNIGSLVLGVVIGLVGPWISLFAWQFSLIGFKKLKRIREELRTPNVGVLPGMRVDFADDRYLVVIAVSENEARVQAYNGDGNRLGDPSWVHTNPIRHAIAAQAKHLTDRTPLNALRLR